MTDDLVELLLESELNMDYGAWASCREAAVEILRLRAENEKLRAELRDADVMLLNQARTIRDYQDAAAALKETGDD